MGVGPSRPGLHARPQGAVRWYKMKCKSCAQQAGAHQRGSPELAALGPGQQGRVLLGHPMDVHIRLQPQALRLLVCLRASPS